LDKDGNGTKYSEKSIIIKVLNPNRQEKNRTCTRWFSSTEKILFVTDLGGDIIQQIPFDEDSTLAAIG
jgi:hypothetical protein